MRMTQARQDSVYAERERVAETQRKREARLDLDYRVREQSQQNQARKNKTEASRERARQAQRERRRRARDDRRMDVVDQRLKDIRISDDDHDLPDPQHDDSDVVSSLTELEERLVSPRIPFMQIRPLGVDRQHGLHDDPCQQDEQPNDSREDENPAADDNEKGDKDADEDDEWDETKNDEPVNPGVCDTLLDNNDDTAIRFAPGEGQKPLPVLMDEDCEELSFPSIYVGVKRTTPRHVSYGDIAKSEARRYDRRATKVPKLFFSYKKMEMTRVSGAIQTCLRKAAGARGYTAKDMLNNESVSAVIKSNDGFRVLKSVRGSPPFWELKKKELLAMVRQLGCPTFFFTLSAAETKWPELLVILGKVLRQSDMTKDEATALSFQEKTALLREDPVTCARYFDHRFRALFNKVLKSAAGPLGEIVDFFYRVEFQHRGSPHIHGLLWIKDAPVYDSEDPDSAPPVVEFIDRYITCHKPQEDQPTHEEVKLQQHKHSHTCLKQKGKEKTCRFGIPHYPMPETMILEPIKDQDLSDNPNAAKRMRDQLKKQAKAISERLKTLRPEDDIQIADMLREQDMTMEQYIMALRTTIKRSKVFLKRDISERRTNAYNTDILTLWRANMDLQYIVDPYACVMYIINYVGKAQRGMSTLLRNALTEVRKGNVSIKEQLRKIGNVFVNSSELSAQEACYYLLGIPVTNASRTSVFVNTGEPGKRVGMLKPEEVLKSMDPDSTDIMCSGLLDHYVNRPECLQDLCLADFATKYNYQGQDPGKNVPHDDEEGDDQETTNTTEKFQLQSGGYIIKRKKSKILRFRNFDQLKDPTNYCREQLMLYHPWRDEETELININHEARYEELKDNITVKRMQYCCRRETELVRAAEEIQQAGADDDDHVDDVVPIADLDEDEMSEHQDEFVAMEAEEEHCVDVLEQIGQPARQEGADQFGGPLPTLSADVSNTIATKLYNLKLIVIDEISMCPRSNEGYAELAGPTLWEKFCLVELTEIMRQRDDLPFAQALTRLARGKMEEADIELFKSRQFPEGDPSLPPEALHLYQTNAKVWAHNTAVLNTLDTEGAVSTAADVCQADGLVNGATGQLLKIDYGKRSDGSSVPVRVWMMFDDAKVGAEARQKRFENAYMLVCDGNTRKPYGMSVYSRWFMSARVEHENQMTGPGWHAEIAAIRMRGWDGLTVVVVYKSPKAPVHTVQELLKTYLATLSPIQAERLVVVGDFNVRRNTPEGEALVSFFSSESVSAAAKLRPMLPPDVPTTNQGTQIDMCFTSIPRGISVGTYESVTSYHKPLWVVLDE
nr:hypothetical protein BaRGS_030059 [Batillaria attramentaria]